MTLKTTAPRVLVIDGEIHTREAQPLVDADTIQREANAMLRSVLSPKSSEYVDQLRQLDGE